MEYDIIISAYIKQTFKTTKKMFIAPATLVLIIVVIILVVFWFVQRSPATSNSQQQHQQSNSKNNTSKQTSSTRITNEHVKQAANQMIMENRKKYLARHSLPNDSTLGNQVEVDEVDKKNE